MLRGMYEVLISAQENQFVPDAELRNERVDRTKLHTRSATGISKACCGNMVCALGLDQCERREALDYLLARLGAGEALEQFL